jgi:hypothetical protein
MVKKNRDAHQKETEKSMQTISILSCSTCSIFEYYFQIGVKYVTHTTEPATYFSNDIGWYKL